MRYPHSGIQRRLEDAFLDEILQALVCEVNAGLVKGVGAASHVLWPREINETNEGGKIFATQPKDGAHRLGHPAWHG